jgi:hypothetical protein
LLLLVLDHHVPGSLPHVSDESSSNHLCTAATHFEPLSWLDLSSYKTASVCNLVVVVVVELEESRWWWLLLLLSMLLWPLCEYCSAGQVVWKNIRDIGKLVGAGWQQGACVTGE